MKKLLVGLYTLATLGSCVATRGVKHTPEPQPRTVIVVDAAKDTVPTPTTKPPRILHIDKDSFGIVKHPTIRHNFSRPRAKVTLTTTASTYSAPANIVMNSSATVPGGGIVRVDFMNGAVVVASDATSPYTGTWSNVPAGTYNLIARSLSTTNTFTYSNSVTVTVTGVAPPPPPANVPPIITLTSPANNSTFVGNPAAFAVSFQGSDPDGTVVQTELFVNGVSAGVQSGANVTFNLSKTPATYTIFGRSTDNSGAVSTSGTITVVVSAPAPPPPSNTPPITAITSPASGATFTGNPALFNVVVSGSDADGSIVQTDLLVNGTTVATSSLGNVTFALSKAPGSYAIHTVAKDNAGATTTSATVNVTVNAPAPPPTNLPPVVTLTSPANGTTYPVSPANFSVVFNQSDPDGTVASFQLFINGAFAGGASGTSPLQFDLVNKPTGTYTIYGVSKDNLGATTTSNTITVTVGSTPPPPPTNQSPVVSITSPASGASFTGNPATFNVVVADSDPDGTISKTELYINSVLYATQSIANPTFSVNELPGTYTVYAKAYDNSTGATNSAAKTITVVAPTPSNTPPTISITSPTASTTFTGNPANFNVTFNSADADGTVSETDLYVNNALAATSTGGGLITYTLSKTPGTYVIYGKAIDNVGASTNSSSITITVVAPAPPPPPSSNIPPTVSITSPPSGTTFTEHTDHIVNLTLGDADGTVVATTLTLNGIAGEPSYTGGSTTPQLNAYGTGLLAAGTYTVIATATDNAGAKTTSAPITINFAAAPPAPPPPPSVTKVYTNCLYINFNGGTYTGSQWNVTTYAASGLSTTEQDNIVQSVQNDYSFTQLLVTRDVNVYNTYAPTHRFQCNVTTTYAWYPNVGGVSYTGSFNWGDGTPNWAFSPQLGYSTKMVGECVSHECGHATGLGHSNDYGTACSVIGTYYAGLGTNPIGFAPVMGNSYYKTLSLWDDGEPFINSGCTAAAKDQVATIIAMLGQQPDDFANNLTVTPTNAFPVTGTIETRNDIDALAVPIGNILVQPVTNDKGEDPNLHLTVDFYNNSKVYVATYTSETALGVTVPSTGGYILVRPRANAAHSTYGMLGQYRVTLASGAKYYPKIILGDHLTPHVVPKKNDALLAPKRF